MILCCALVLTSVAPSCTHCTALATQIQRAEKHISPPHPPPPHSSPQVDHVKAERNVLAEVRHHSIVRLLYSFQDEEFLYLVMEYMPGGDLMTLLIKKEILPEPMARFYLAQVCMHMCMSTWEQSGEVGGVGAWSVGME